MTYRRNPRYKKSEEEKAFKKMFGDYPKSENELKQIRPYLKFKKTTQRWDVAFKNL